MIPLTNSPKILRRVPYVLLFRNMYLFSVVASLLMICHANREALAGEPVNLQYQSHAKTTADFFHLVVVPNQTVTTETFEVQVIAEHIDPRDIEIAPIAIDGYGKSRQMALKTLKWPGTTDDSVAVYSVIVPLVTNQENTIKVTSGARALAFLVRHKSVLQTRSASSPTELAQLIKAAISDPMIDVVLIDYDEVDLGRSIHNIGRNIVNNRRTWLTIKPVSGRKVTWARNSGTPISRPKVDFLHISGVSFGSDTSDGGGGQFYTETGHRIWLSEVEFRAKYKRAWPKTTPMTANYLSDIRVFASEGQKVFFTDCLWDGTASTTATSSAQLARDLRFKSHRGDFNNFGKVFLNALAEDVFPVRNSDNTDFLHNDGFQVWGNTSGLIFKGFKVTSPNIAAELQPFLFDRTFIPNYSNILVDSLIIQGAVPSVLRAQLAGNLSDSRVSNISFPHQSMNIRQDFTETNGAFSPNNFFVDNAHLKSIGYVARTHRATKEYGIHTSPTNVSKDLNENPMLSGAIFSNIKVTARP
jgi:hypothetical protein